MKFECDQDFVFMYPHTMRPIQLENPKLIKNIAYIRESHYIPKPTSHRIYAVYGPCSGLLYRKIVATIHSVYESDSVEGCILWCDMHNISVVNFTTDTWKLFKEITQNFMKIHNNQEE